MKGKDSKHKYKIFRESYPFMNYESYKIKTSHNIMKASFHFNLSDIYHFKPSIEFPIQDSFPNIRDKLNNLGNFIFHFGMIELISYWKTSCSPVVFVKPNKLNDDQVSWWKKLYYNGLGEFFYLNGIQPDPENFMILKSKSRKTITKITFQPENKTIVPIGGGKDSIVSLELLRKSGTQIIPLIINPLKSQLEVLALAGFEPKDAIIIKRHIDPELLRLNKEGYLNGHTPFSALVAFLSIMAAYLTSSKYIALSNESSANEATIPGTHINHQYSKSFEFEQDFRNYTSDYLCENCEYFSFLRPLNELQIGRLFAKNDMYFNAFKSCNSGSKKGIWCGKCPKCLFTFIILSPFISLDKLEKIFGKNLFNDTELLPIFKQLSGLSEEKPFDCVGTIREVRAALDYTARNNKRNKSYLLNYFREQNLNIPDEDFRMLSNTFDPDNFLNTEFENLLMNALK